VKASLDKSPSGQEGLLFLRQGGTFFLTEEYCPRDEQFTLDETGEKNMKIEVEFRDKAVIVSPVGDMDLDTADRFRREVDDLLRSRGGRTHLVLNLGSLEFIDSSGIAAILGRYKRLHQEGGRLSLARPSGAVAEVLSLSGLCTLVPVYDSVSAALAVPGSPPPATSEGGCGRG